MLLTKINLPAVRAQWVDRARLLNRLDTLRAARVILVSAPPGYGKTTLVAAWLRRLEGVRVAWLSLDQADNDPVRFWSYVVAALQASRRPAHPEMVLGQGFLELIRSPQPPPLEKALVVLVNEIASSPAERLLVLDDYQVIENASIQAGMRFLVEAMPENLHVVITTRADPPFVLARYRARGWLAELRPADLRFDLAETGDFLSQTMRLELDAQEVAALEERTDGWIAGLQLAALALQANPEMTGEDRRSIIASFTGDDRYVMDYFIEEVLSRQPEELRAFLLKTAVLDRFSAGLCGAVTGREDSQALIERLEQANLFIIPLDNRRGWYRYHPLFAALLRSVLQQEEPSQLGDAHRRAAQWLGEHDLAEDAIRHALAAGELDEASRYMESRLSNWMEYGEVETLLSWLERFPREYILARPGLCLGYGWVALFQARFPEAGDWARRAAAVIPADRSHTWDVSFYQGQIDLLLGTVAINQKDRDLGVELSRRALPLIPEEYSNMRSLAYLNLGDASHMQGQYLVAEEAFQKAYEAAHDSSSRSMEIIIIGSLGNLYLHLGRLRQAERVFQQALLVEKDVRAQGGPELPPLGKPLVYLAMIYQEWNQLDQALETAQRALDLCTRWGHPEHQMDALMCLSGVHSARGEIDAARQTVARAREMMEQIEASSIPPEVKKILRDTNRQRILYREMMLALEHGSRAEADACLARLQETGNIDDGILAWYDVHAGKMAEALPLLQQLQAEAETQHRLEDEVRALVRLSLAHQALGQAREASGCLEHAVEKAKAEGYIRSFLVGGAAVRKLLGELLRHPGRADPGYIQELLDAFPPGDAGDEDAAQPADEPGAGIEPLSERELEMLRFLAAGRTYPEIAALLYLSINTVKTHVKRLYAKLGVDSRLAAVDLARKQGLL